MEEAGGEGVVWRQLSHNEATGFVSSSEDLVNPELCRAALDRKERPAGAEPPSMTTSFILCHCIQIYYIPNTYHPTATTLLGTHRPTLKTDHRGERTYFPLFPKSDWHKLKQRNFLCVSAPHNGEHTAKNGHLQLVEATGIVLFVLDDELRVPQSHSWGNYRVAVTNSTHQDIDQCSLRDVARKPGTLHEKSGKNCILGKEGSSCLWNRWKPKHSKRKVKAGLKHKESKDHVTVPSVWWRQKILALNLLFVVKRGNETLVNGDKINFSCH